MRLMVNYALGLVTVGLFALTAVAILIGTLQTPGYAPHGLADDIFDLSAGGVVAFLVTTLGLAVANEATNVGDSLRMATSGEEAKSGGEWLIAVVAGLYLLIGLAFVVVGVFPDLVAVEADAEALKDAPDFITTPAKAFVGVALGGLAAIGAAVKAPPAP